jgi:Mn-dependent DtxR family transcriptional regulator
MGEIELNPTDEAVIEVLKEGRATPSYLAERTEYSRQNVTNRLRRLAEHGYVEKIHKGLYELQKEPESTKND